MVDGVKIRYAATGGSHGSTLPLTSPWSIDASHFVWEEAPGEYASIILASLA